MANYANLKSDIAGVIRTNNNEEITGDILQEQLFNMVDELGAGYQYMGIAIPTTNPGSPDANVFYIASTAGTYTNFGGAVVADGEVAILKYNGSWTKEVSGAATAAQVTQLGRELDGSPQVGIDSDDYELINGVISNGYFYNTNNFGLYNRCKLIPVSQYAGRKVRITPNTTGSRAFYVTVLAQMVSPGTAVVFATGFSSVDYHNTDYEIELPSDAEYLYFFITDTRTTNDFTPGSITILEEEGRFYTKEEVDEIADNLGDGIDGINTFLDENVKIELPDSELQFNEIPSKLISGSGEVIDFSNANYIVSDEINIVGGKTYFITASSAYTNLLYAFYDSSRTKVDSYPSAGGGTITSIVRHKVVAPSNAVYLRVARINPAIMEVFDGKIEAYVKNFFPYLGKKWVCIGDSLTEANLRTNIHYFDYVAEQTGLNVVNLGVSGTGYAKGTNTFLTRVSSIPLDADIITIFGSFNDLTAGISLGSITDSDNTTICGCINLTLDAIQARVPIVPLGIVSPTPWKSAGPNPQGTSVADNYVAALRDICAYRSIPFLDLYHESNLHPDSADFRVLCYSKDGTYSESTSSTPGAIEVTADNIATIQEFGVPSAQIGDWVLPNLVGCHPNEEGHRLIAGRFKSFVEKVI